MNRPPRWLQLLPVSAMLLAAAVLALIPSRSKRAEQIAATILVLAAAVMLAAVFLLFGYRYSHAIGGLS